MGPSPIQSADGFQGILNGILQGQALKQRLRQAQLEEQAFKTQQARDNQQATVEDIMNRMTLQGSGLQPVNSDNTVDLPTSTYSSPMSLGPSSGSTPSLAPSPSLAQGPISTGPAISAPTIVAKGSDGQMRASNDGGRTWSPVQNTGQLPASPSISPTQPSAARSISGTDDVQTSVPGGRVPLSPDRQTATYSGIGGSQKYALPTRQQLLDMADVAAARARQNKVLDTTAEEQAKQDVLNQAHIRSRELQLEAEGGGVGAPPEFSAMGVQPGTKLTRAEMQAGYETLAKQQEQQANTRKTNASAQELEQQNQFLQNLKPEDIHAQVDKAIPLVDASGKPIARNSALNQRTHVLVNTALMMGDKKGALQAVKDSSDQLGRTETSVETAKQKEPIQISVATGEAAAKNNASGMTEDDFQREGQKYALTGVMPPLGMQAGGRQKILHYANEFARQNGYTPQDLAQIQASYAGDKDSLKKLQTQRDQIVSFEQTASKNLDQFIDLASKIPDTGSPWLNLPLRQLNQGLVGNDAMAAVNAARQVANNEIAKVTSGGGINGVLSDSARKEVEGFNPQNATLKQTLAVAKVLRADMANRHQALDATLSDIKGRIGNPNAGGGAGAVKVTAPDGSVHTFPDQASADKFKQLAGIK